jgi:hypothetical protein
MIERQMLKDMGFILGKGWDHEVWVRDGDFWVHYIEELDTNYLKDRKVSGYITRREFFNIFLGHLENRENIHEYL